MPISRTSQFNAGAQVVDTRFFAEHPDGMIYVRWQTQRPTEVQRREIARFEGELTHLRTTLDAALAVADKLKDGTIERALAKSDLELGIEAMLRHTRRSDD